MSLLIVNKILAYLTLGGHVFIVLAVLYFLYPGKKSDNLQRMLGERGLLLAFGVAAIATAISLFYSNVAGFEPCKLCWYQRIFMYPEVVLLGMALWKKDSKIADYVIALATLGGLIALYHNYIYYGGTSIFPCDAFGLGVSCTRQYVHELGYITIPLMSLTGFILVILFASFQKLYGQKD